MWSWHILWCHTRSWTEGLRKKLKFISQWVLSWYFNQALPTQVQVKTFHLSANSSNAKNLPVSCHTITFSHYLQFFNNIMYFKHRKKLLLQLTSLIKTPYQVILHYHNTSVPMNPSAYYLILTTKNTCVKLMQRLQNKSPKIVKKIITAI